MLRRVKGEGHYRSGPVLSHEGIVQTDAKAGGDHGISGVVITGGKADLRRELVACQQALQICILFRQGLDEGRSIQGLQGKTAAICQRVVLWQPGHKLILLQGNPVALSMIFAEKAAVQLMAFQPLYEIAVAAVPAVNLYARPAGLEGLDDFGQPAGRGTVIGADGEMADTQPTDICAELLQLFLPVGQLLEYRQQALSF